jgi:hypothetical protein
MLRLSSVALAAVILTAGGASAATLSFDFRDASSNVFTSGGVTLTATGHRLNSNGTIGSQRTLGLYDSGLGVTSSSGDQHLVDGAGDHNDVVRFAFSQTVRILSVTLAYADRNDTFSFGYQGNSGYVHVTSAQGLTNGNTTWNTAANPDEARYSFNSAYWSSIFGIGAIDGDSEFKIAAMTVETAPSVVPLPAAGWALIAGLGALAAVKRRKSAA